MNKDHEKLFEQGIKDIKEGHTITYMDIERMFDRLDVPIDGDRWRGFLALIEEEHGLRQDITNYAQRELIRSFVKYAVMTVLVKVAGIRCIVFDEDEEDE